MESLECGSIVPRDQTFDRTIGPVANPAIETELQCALARRLPEGARVTVPERSDVGADAGPGGASRTRCCADTVSAPHALDPARHHEAI